MITPERARKIIDEIGLVQYKISDACSIKSTHFTEWLKNRREFSVSQLNRIEEHLSKFESLT